MKTTIFKPVMNEQLNISSLVQKYMLFKGLDEIDILSASKLCSPFECKGIKECQQLLIQIRDQKQKILICGDYDCDGICATTILCKAFDAIGLEYGFYIPSRIQEGYGLNAQTVKLGLAKGYRHFITVDNGVKAFEAMQLIKDAHASLIITDHHAFDIKEIDCDCFIHPFLMEAKFHNLSGAGVALQIALSLIPDSKEIIVLAALACIADCMTFDSYNHHLVRLGIEYLRQGVCPAIHALKNKPEDVLDETSIAFQIVPKINGTGRMDEIAKANNTVKYLLLNDLNAIFKGAEQINKVNEIRRSKTNEMETIANKQINEDAFQVITSPYFHEGVVGIVASRLSNRLNKVVMILSELEYVYKGSIRSVEGCDLIAFFSEFEYFEAFGGHYMAAGVTIRKEYYSKLIDYIQKHQAQLVLLEPERRVCLIEESDCDDNSVNQYLSLKPFGNGLEEGLFLLERVQIESVMNLSNGKHMKFRSAGGLDYIYFNVKENACKIVEGSYLDCIVRISMNVFRGKKSVQLMIEDVYQG